MEDAAALNLTPSTASPPCERWGEGSEGAVFHLANIFLFLGFMGGSSLYGLLYLFLLLTAGFFCATLWAWAEPCTGDSFLWSLVLFGVCLAQALYVGYRLRSVAFQKEFQELYNCVFKKLGVSVTLFRKIVACSEGEVHIMEPDRCFAVEGKTAIDKLSVLLSGRSARPRDVVAIVVVVVVVVDLCNDMRTLMGGWTTVLQGFGWSRWFLWFWDLHLTACFLPQSPGDREGRVPAFHTPVPVPGFS